MSHDLNKLEASICRDSLSEFFKRSWPVLEPSTPLVWNWHLEVICNHVQALLEKRIGGDSRHNLVINVPPGSAKSRIVSVCAPAWIWTKNPTWRGIFASASGTVSTRDAKLCSDLVDSEWYQARFAGVQLYRQRGTEIFYNRKGGWRRATTTGARITGERADGTFIDDPLDAAEANSEAARLSSIEWHDQAFSNRLNDLRHGTRCLIMQRLHDLDLSGHVLATGLWEHLEIPQEFEPQRRKTTCLGWTDPRSVEGQLMFEERFPKEVLDGERKRLGTRGYNGQHQQRPAPLEGGIVKRAWLRYYTFDPQTATFDQVILSFDMNFKDGVESDYVVGQVWGRRGSDFYLLDQVRAVMDFVSTLQAVRSLSKKWPKAYWKLIEDKANGPAVINMLKHEIHGIIPIEPQGSKDSRLHSVSPLFEAGNVHLPQGAPWLSDYVEELVAFSTEGSTVHDDQIDSTTQALIRLRNFPRGIQQFYAEGAENNAEADKTGTAGAVTSAGAKPGATENNGQ
jgi:predicted phage terminase large subunit-like protein